MRIPARRNPGTFKLSEPTTFGQPLNSSRLAPRIIQAGKVNFNSTTATEGFSSGYAPSYPSYPWPDNVKYYRHTTALIAFELEAEPVVVT